MRQSNGMAAGTKTILITGSTSGVGRRVAERLATPGNTILVHGRDRKRAQGLLRAIREKGATSAFYAADFASLDDVRRMAGGVRGDCSRLDVLINNAGIGVAGAYPGRSATYMDTPMVRGDGVSPVSSVDEGADAILNLAVSPGVEGRTGLFFDGLQPSRANSQAYDANARARLRALSFKLTGLAQETA